MKGSKKSLFSNGSMPLTPQQWEESKADILEKAERYDRKHDVGTGDEEIIHDKVKESELPYEPKRPEKF